MKFALFSVVSCGFVDSLPLAASRCKGSGRVSPARVASVTMCRSPVAFARHGESGSLRYAKSFLNGAWPK